MAAASALLGGADEVVAVAVDADPADPDGFATGVRVVDITEFGVSLEEVGRSIGAHGVGRLKRVVLPAICRCLGENGDPTVFLAEDTLVLAPLDALWEALDEHDSVLVPRLLNPSYDQVPSLRTGLHGEIPPSPAALVATHAGGAINGSVIGVQAGSESFLLRRWPLEVGRVSHYDPYPERDYKAWLASIALDDSVHVTRDPGVAVGFFNLRERDVGRDGGVITASSRPLALLDMRAHDPRLPLVLAPGQFVGFLSDAPALIDVVANYADSLMRAGWTEPPWDERDESPRDRLLREQGRWAKTDNGTYWTPIMRSAYRAGISEGRLSLSPFQPIGESEAFDEFKGRAARGGAVGINRLMWRLWLCRPELQAAYPVLDGADGPGFVGWVWAFGQEQELFPSELIPSWAERFADGERSVDERAVGLDEAETAVRAEGELGVNVAGYLATEIGLGESARLIVRALTEVDIDVQPVQGRLIPVARQLAETAFVSPEDACYDISLLVINGDGIPEFARDVGEGFFRDRYTIGFWWWEVDPYPAKHWNLSLPWLDEIWVGTEFVRDLIEPHVDVPVVHVRTPVSPPPQAAVTRDFFGIDNDETMFLHVYNYQSAGERKNPLGLVNAYVDAFTPEDGCRLVLKSVGKDHRVEEHEAVKVASHDRSDITIIDGYLDAGAKDSLISLADCYVSPHRSEGFGYSLAEAMMYGKPVICTNYGGVTDFANEDTALLVDWTPQRVGPFAPPYPPSGTWADPSHDGLVAQMRWVKANPEEAAALGARAGESIRKTHSFEASGRSMRRRLTEVQARLAGGYSPRAGIHPDTLGRKVTKLPPEFPTDAREQPIMADESPTVRRRAMERAARISAVAKVRRSWWGVMDRAVASRTRPAFDELAREIEAGRNEMSSTVVQQMESMERTLRREVQLLEEQIAQLTRLVGGAPPTGRSGNGQSRP